MADRDSTGLPLNRMFADMVRTLRRDLFTSYRPERHYMRGPGPKWREKHAPMSREASVPDGLHVGA